VTLEPSASGSIFVLMIPATWTCTVELFGTCGVLNRHSKWQYGPSDEELLQYFNNCNVDTRYKRVLPE
jgi:hypothetical protein